MKFVYIFLTVFVAGFILGGIHAVKDNSEPTDFADVIEQICPHLNLEVGDSTSWISYKCKNQNRAFISFETLKVRTDPNFEFKEKKFNLPFVSFDRIYSTVGGGLLLGWSIKDVFKTTTESKSIFTILAGVLGGVTGYGLGYYLFKKNLDCQSKEIESIFTNKEKLSKLKKRVIAQNLVLEALVAKNKDSLKCIYLGKMSKDNVLRFCNVQKLMEDSVLTQKFITVENDYEKSYNKLWENSLDSFNTYDLNNIQRRIEFLKQVFSNPTLTSKKYTEYKIKTTAELSKDETEALIKGD